MDRQKSRQAGKQIDRNKKTYRQILDTVSIYTHYRIQMQEKRETDRSKEREKQI